MGKYLWNRPVLGRPFKGAIAEWPDVSFDENGEPEYKGWQNYAPHPSTDYRIVENRLFTQGRDELWPIPESERNLNPGLAQNPGY
ncbi:RagB/SusD family nutrient uptake outer membrane protein [Parabacteroides sp. AF48-14]|uniref:RagB/SusD family nutrient uptake outer membrane protein n=1 Tax=Parabacteroides sp. AF48-14 TaxID=2292052 RepID=UPI00210689BA|nr:RagB/SusD family nutrient uptake outer membrane protein [Parabacteroides sp. AF48-14]